MKKTIALTAVLYASAALFGGETVPEEWLTVAEKTDFRATSTLAETEAFLARAQRAAPDVIRVSSFGTSGMGHYLPMVIVSSDGAFDRAEMEATGKPILLIQSCIHAGEVDGKVATLMILRDIALGRRPDLTENVITVFAPIYNADGHENVSPYHRANQNGPVDGTGYRATASGINLNRDYLRLASPEARAMARLISTLDPDLHVDNHVTNGSDHAWILTWLVAEAPQLDPGVAEWVSEHLPQVLAETAAEGYPNGPYVNLLSGSDPSNGMIWDVNQPRYSTGYFPLRGRPSILIEMNAHVPFEERVHANRAFLEALILEVGRSGKELTQAVSEADERVTALGRPDADPSDVVVTWGVAEKGEKISWPASVWTTEESVVTGRPMVRYQRGETRDVELEWRHLPVPELSLPRPRGYLVLPGWPQIDDVLAGHHLVVDVLTQEAEVEVETIRLANPKFASSSFQGVVMVEDFEVSRQPETRKVPVGSLWIPADQPDFEVAVQLFEPEAPDSLVRWGAVSSVFERKIYIGSEVLESLARAMLEDPAIRQEWEAALEDPEFAGDAGARYLWWYRRTPYWDETVGLLPIMRVMKPSKFAKEPWPGP